ncbi:MAG: DUF5752 family protein [Planctomycetaceae bacterium]|nr:DUF5752 family protein [Planctomycetaceae bacterium]
MDETEPFCVMDCSLVRLATGRTCSNLRELLEAIRTAPEAVIEHHMMRCAVADHFELYEFPNDFARWCWTALGDNVAAEELGLIDPYRQYSSGPLRAMLVNTIEGRLWGLDHVRWCRPGLELHLIESRLIAYDTEERLNTPSALLDAIEQMSMRSLFYHVHEARRRTEGRSDDFSAWLEQLGADPGLISALRAIDFYFLNLSQLREALIEAFRRYVAGAPPVPRSVA